MSAPFNFILGTPKIMNFFTLITPIVIANPNQMDAAACAELKGVLNERNQCLVDTQTNPDDPNHACNKSNAVQMPMG